MKRISSLLIVLILILSLTTMAQAAEVTDVAEDSPYAEAIQWALDNELITGYSDGTFRPNTTCTRGHAAAILWRAAGEPTPTLDSNPFRDVSPRHTYYNAILWAVETGITTGITANTFDPNVPCTNAQILTFLWRAEGLPSTPVASVLACAYSGAYYADALAWAEYTGFLDVSPEDFIPNAPASRAGIANYLYLKSMPRMTEDAPLAGAGQLIISQQPQSMEPSGGMVTFKVEASGGKAPYTYNWESKTGSGAWFRVYDTSSNTLNKFPAASMITSGLYFRCVVSDAAGSKVTSDEVKVLTAGESFSGPSGGTQSGTSQSGSTPPSTGPLTIKTQPQSIVAKAGNAVTFKVEVSGGKAPYTYKWESKNSATDWTRVYDSTSNTLTKYPTLDMMKSGLRFRCTITDAGGNTVVSNEAAVSSTDQDIVGIMGVYDPNRPMYIYRELLDQSCRAGDPLKLNFDTGGGENPHSYIWEYRTGSSSWKKFDGGSLRSRTEYTPTQRELDAGLQIRARAYDQNDKELSSRIAFIRPLDTPSDGTLKIVSQPQNVFASNYSAGDIISYSVEVIGGTAPYQYQWQLACTSYIAEDNCGFTSMVETPGGWATGYTSAQLNVPYAADMQEDNMKFCCVITDAKGNSVVSKPVGFADGYVGPYITEDPRSSIYYPKLYDEMDETTTTEFTVAAIGGVLPYSYQWQYRPEGRSEWINFSKAESSWAWDYTTDELTVLARPKFSFSDPNCYQSPAYRCKITDAAGNSMYSKTAVSIIYD